MQESPYPVIKREQSELIPNAQNLRILAKEFLDSGLFPNVKSLAGMVTVIEYGRELGFPPAVSLQTMSIVNGRICIESKVLLALFQRSGGVIEILKKDKEGSKVKFMRPGLSPLIESFTIEDAEALGFLNKNNWKMYPEEMCYWRCIAKGVRAYDPSVFMGYTVEEMRDANRNFEGGSSHPETVGSNGEATPSPAPEMHIPPDIITEETLASLVGGCPANADGGDAGTPLPEEAKPQVDDTGVAKALSREIHIALSLSGVKSEMEQLAFLNWLFKYQYVQKPPRVYCQKDEGGAVHLSMGNVDDLKYLHANLTGAIKQWKKDIKANAKF